MLIKSITLNNFRQFKGKQILEFSTDTDKNVTVLLGDNTFGKRLSYRHLTGVCMDWQIFQKTVIRIFC